MGKSMPTAAVAGGYGEPSLARTRTEDEQEDQTSPPSLVRVERHTRIEFPSKCILERKVKLRLQLTKAVPSLNIGVKKLRLLVGRRTKTLKIDVNITAPGFALREWHKQLVFPVTQDSETIEFTLVP